jgi:hypothetical protein
MGDKFYDVIDQNGQVYCILVESDEPEPHSTCDDHVEIWPRESESVKVKSTCAPRAKWWHWLRFT